MPITPKERGCYCPIENTNPETPKEQRLPKGFCGWCEICREPGHFRQYPGPIACSGAWCDPHYEALGAKTSELMKSLHPIAERLAGKVVHWVVWRQDEHGNRFEVTRQESAEEAVVIAASHELKGHKQYYWVEPHAE